MERIAEMKSVGESIGEVMNLVTPEIEATRPKTQWKCSVCGVVNDDWVISKEWIFKKVEYPWKRGECPNCVRIEKRREYQRQVADFQKAKMNRIKQIFRNSGIPEDYGRFAFKGLEVRKGAEKAFGYLRDLENFQKGKPFVILSGPNNTGKSALLGALTNKLSLAEIPCFYINEPVMFGKIKEGFDSTEPIEKELYEAFSKADVVMWDEFLFYNYTEKNWIYERAYRVIEEAVESEKIIVFATNYSLPDIMPRCGKRIWARLTRKKSNFIRMDNKPFFDGLNVL